MTSQAFALFDTPIGHCGIAWTPRGIAGVQLPEGDLSRTRARLVRRFPQAREEVPRLDVQLAIAAMIALLGGEPRDLSAVTLDLEGVSSFHRRVYDVTRRIAPGETLSYGEIAAQLGEPGSARAVGQALGQNPFPIVVPCHRVLAADGSMGGFSAAGGVETKMRLLTIERALRQGTFDFS